MDFLYTAVSWVLLRWHSLFTAIGLDPAGGLNWALSIVFLVVTARLLLFRLFVKQVHYQRHMQEIQPEIQKLREKYKNDRAEMQRQMMALQQEQGFNPLAGCLPMFLQIPVFISLFHVLRHLANSIGACQQGASYHGGQLTLYTFTRTETCNAAQAKLFGAPLAGSLRDGAHTINVLLGGDITSTRIVTIVLVVISAAATYLTQILVTSRATTVPTGTAATVQKLMKVFIPISVLFSGVFFPLGVLLYWFTSNTWTLLQQMYINRYHPPKPKETAEVGAVGKTLAPKPGQKPTRAARTRPANPANGVGTTNTPDTGSTDDGAPPRADDAAPGTARSTAPRPGQKPQRPGAKRPPSKRPSQAKKRR
ncbi:MAG TPA: membrane protein insertase YidC [Jatrophihabitans sp.]